MKKLLILVFCVISNFCFSQCPECDGVLLLGFNEYSIFTQNDLNSAFSEMLSKTDEELEQITKNKQSGSSANGSYKGRNDLISAAWSKNKNKSEWRSKFNSARLDYKTSGIFNTSLIQDIASKTVNDETVHSWTICKEKQFDCIKTLKTSESAISPKSFATEIIGDTNTNFTLVVHFKPQSGLENVPTKIVSISYSPNLIKTQPVNIDTGRFITPYTGISQSFTRINKDAPANIIITLENFSPIRLNIQGERSSTSGVPIGTIIASSLTYTELCKTIKESVSWSSTNTWAPADGRSVAGSRYADINVTTPDLRGVFLRGLNTFYEGNNHSGPLNTLQLDPDNSRAASSPQYSATQLPKIPFKGTTNEAGNHFHIQGNYHQGSSPYGIEDIGGNNQRADANVRPDNKRFKTSEAGNHTHLVTLNGGGDIETRPTNIAVYYYIKIN